MAYAEPVLAMKAQADAISSQYFDNTLRKVVYEGSVLIDRMMKSKKVKIKGGRVIQWPVRIDTLGDVDAVDPRTPVDWAHKDTRVAAQTNWKYYHGGTMIHWDEILQNDGKPQLVDLIKDKTEELKDDVQERFITDMYSTAAQGATRVDSLNTLIGTGVYGGIDPAGLVDGTRWESHVDATTTKLYFWDGSGAAGAGADVSTHTLAQIIIDATFNKQKPSLIITTDEIFSGIEAYLEGQKRRTEDSALAKMGYENVKFKNIPIVPDPRCPAGYMYGIDEDALELIVHPSYDMKTTSWESHEDMPNALYKGVSWAGNFRAAYRHTCFRLTALAGVETFV